MVPRHLFALALLIASATLGAQTATDGPQEEQVKMPALPDYSSNKLIAIEMPPYVTLKVAIDPESLVIGADGVVRYVVVMRSATGSVNAAYEGIQCANGEVKTYARVSSAGHWVSVNQPQWKAMTDNLPSRHAYAIAQQGACEGRAAAKAENIVRAFRQRSKNSY